VSKRRGVTKQMSTEQNARRRNHGRNDEFNETEEDEEMDNELMLKAPELVINKHWIPGVLELWYLGCFIDYNYHLLERWCAPSKPSRPIPLTNPIEACTKEAADRKYNLISMQPPSGKDARKGPGVICWCDTDRMSLTSRETDWADRYPQQPDSECGLPNAEGVRDGGDRRNAVYNFTVPTPFLIDGNSVELTYLGCFHKNKLSFDDNRCPKDNQGINCARTEKCARSCADDKGGTHISQQSGGDCYCGTLEKMTSHSEPLVKKTRQRMRRPKHRWSATGQGGQSCGLRIQGALNAA